MRFNIEFRARSIFIIDNNDFNVAAGFEPAHRPADASVHVGRTIYRREN